MDDTGLQSKVKGNKLTDDDQKQIDDALNKLPDMPGVDSTSTAKADKPSDVKPAEPVSPPPVTPKTTTGGLPPLPPIPPVIPPVDEPNITEEKPETNKPPSKLKQGLKKNGKKIAGGMLVLTLVAGGILGVNLTRKTTVEEKQVVESEATGAGKCDLPTNCVGEANKKQCKGCGFACVGNSCCPSGGSRCRKKGEWQCRKTPSIWECIEFSPTCTADKRLVWRLRASEGQPRYDQLYKKYCKKKETHSVCNPTTFACEQAAGAGTNECTTNEDCEEETHLECNETTFTCEVVTGAGTDTCADDPDCAQPSLACEDLTSTPSASLIEIDDTVTFTCEGSFSSVTVPVAYFRHSIDGGTPVVDPFAYPIDLVTNTASADILVDEYGDWSVECRVCEDNTAVSCTAWGQAN